MFWKKWSWINRHDLSHLGGPTLGTPQCWLKPACFESVEVCQWYLLGVLERNFFDGLRLFLWRDHFIWFSNGLELFICGQVPVHNVWQQLKLYFYSEDCGMLSWNNTESFRSERQKYVWIPTSIVICIFLQMQWLQLGTFGKKKKT